jgi:hypothetical protein
MDIDIVRIIVILVIAGLCWYANNALNKVPVLVTVINVLIIVFSVLLVLNASGLMTSNAGHIRI